MTSTVSDMLRKVFLTILCNVCLAGVAFFTSCSKDDDNGGTSNALCGKWICISQTISEDGESSTKEYENENNYLVFNEDGTGEIRADQSLFEIGTHGGSKSFNWRKEGREIVSDIYGITRWEILSLKGNRLKLLWDDGDLKISAEFRRKVETNETSYSDKLTEDNLIGRWAVMSAYDSLSDTEYNFSYKPEDLATGKIHCYVDFLPDGKGVKEVGHNMILNSTSTSIGWKLKGKSIVVWPLDLTEYSDTWKVVKFDGINLSVVCGKEEATFRRTGLSF